jgi:hypothetical protein
MSGGGARRLIMGSVRTACLRTRDHFSPVLNRQNRDPQPVSERRLLLKFEVFTVVTMKNGVFWDVMPCGS